MLLASPALGHPLAPALLELREVASGQYEVQFKISALQAPGSEPVPRLPSRCRELSPPAASMVGDALMRRWRIDCGDLVGERLGIGGLDVARIDGLVRLTFLDGRVVQDVVRGDAPSFVVPARDTWMTIARGYARRGAAHMLTSLDHLFFLVGLLLLARGARLRAEALIAFAVGGSLTLSLAAFGIAPSLRQPIALAVAMTVFWLAVELAREAPAPTLVQRRPYLIAGSFGLVHGLGLAAALDAIGLPSGDVPLAVVTFNLGVIAAQLAVAAAGVALFEAVRRLPMQWPRWIAQVPLYTMGSLAALWCFQRIAALLR